MTLRVLDLFSGIGGFSLGLGSTGGFRTGMFVEIDPDCRGWLAKHWPSVPIHDDIRTLRGEDVGPVDVVCGGFPCQPWSVAGQQAGADDGRDLWPEMRRVIAAAAPGWVVAENVPGIVQPAMGLARVLGDLGALGYRTVVFDIPAAAVGAPQRRERIWIVAHANQPGLALGQGIGRDDGPERPAAERDRDEGGLAHAMRPAGRQDARGAPNDEGQHAGRSSGDDHRPAGDGEGGDVGGAGLPDWSDAEWIECHDGKWRAVKPGVRLLAHGVPGRVARLKALGNAIVPQIARCLGLAILEAEAAE